MEELADAVRQSRRSPEAFGLVFDEQFMTLVDRLTRRVYDSEIAVDLAAETVADAFAKRRRFRGRTNAEAIGWLNAIADRKLAMFYRKGAVHQRALRKLQLEPPKLTDEEQEEILRWIDASGARQLLRGALESLSSAERDALVLRVAEELSYGQVATKLGVSEEAARARVARGLCSLRKLAGDQIESEDYA